MLYESINILRQDGVANQHRFVELLKQKDTTGWSTDDSTNYESMSQYYLSCLPSTLFAIIVLILNQKISFQPWQYKS